MSNELVYGDATSFLENLAAADDLARKFFNEVVTYLSGCAKNLAVCTEKWPPERKPSASVFTLKVDSAGDTFKLATNFASLTLQCSHPPGSVRFLLEERVGFNSGFHPRGVEGHILFTAAQAEAKSKIENAAEQKPGEGKPQKGAAPAIYATDGFLPPAFKTDSAAAFAEPLFWQLFQPLPVEPPPNKTAEAKQ